jgi:hypothetical protein
MQIQVHRGDYQSSPGKKTNRCREEREFSRIAQNPREVAQREGFCIYTLGFHSQKDFTNCASTGELQCLADVAKSKSIRDNISRR